MIFSHERSAAASRLRAEQTLTFEQSQALEFYENRHIHAVFALTQIWKPDDVAVGIGDGRTWSAGIAPRGCYTTLAGEVRHARATVVVLPAKRDELRRHVVEGCRTIPAAKLVARIFREVGGAAERCCAVDWRQEHQGAAGIRDVTAAERDAKEVAVKPEAIVKHHAEKILLG